MPLVRVGKNAIDVDLVARIEDTDSLVTFVFRDHDRMEMTGDNATAARSLIASLPTYMPDLPFTGECADDTGGGDPSILPGKRDARIERG